MAGADRMTIEEGVKQVMVREQGDVLRAALKAHHAADAAVVLDGSSGRADIGSCGGRPETTRR